MRGSGVVLWEGAAPLFCMFALRVNGRCDMMEKKEDDCIFFPYGAPEIQYLKSKDKRLSEVIDRVGHIDREVDPDLFVAVVHHIVGQQISTKAQATIWQRMCDGLGEINAETVLAAGEERLQSFGISFRKASYIMAFAHQVQSDEFDLDAVWHQPDDEAIRSLCRVKGIGVWTAEMILLFCMQRMDVFSFDDLAIQRGLRMVYHHKIISREQFERYRRRFSPYGSVASLYLWAVSGGAIPDMRDYAERKKAKV